MMVLEADCSQSRRTHRNRQSCGGDGGMAMIRAVVLNVERKKKERRSEKREKFI
jgi:hypothetical protein